MKKVLVSTYSLALLFVCCIGCNSEDSDSFLRFEVLNESVYVAHGKSEERVLAIKQDIWKDNYSDTLYDFVRTGGEGDDYLIALKYTHYPGTVTEEDRRYLIGLLLDDGHDLSMCYVVTKALASIFNHECRFEQALSTYFHFLNKAFDERDLSHDHLRYRDKILIHAINLYNRELTTIEYQPAMKALFDLVTPAYQDGFSGLMTQSRLLDKEEKYRLKGLLDSASILAKTPKEKFTSLFNLGFYHMMKEDTMQHVYLQKSCEVFDENSCGISRFYPAVYGLISPQDAEQEAYYKRILASVDRCPMHVQKQLNFTVFNYLEPSIFGFDVHKQVDTLLGVRRLAESLYKGRSSLHLQDYYVSNLERIFEIYKNKEDEGLDPDVLVQTVVDTRLKEKYRKGADLHIRDASMLKILEEIDALLLRVNNFRKIPSFPDPTYDRLFELFMEVDRMSEPPAPMHHLDQKYTELQEHLSQSKTTLINITKGIDTYCIYTLDGRDMHLSTASVAWVDSVSRVLQEDLRDPSRILSHEVLHALRDSIRFHSEDRKLVCISDGSLSLLPLDLIAGSPVDVYQNLRDFMDRSVRLDIPTQTITSYSFSDSLTIGSRSVRQVPELEGGYQECRFISRLTSSSILAGSECTEQVLFHDKNVQWAHISSHAHSSVKNRLDNKIICRLKGNQVSNLYGYELRSKPHIPPVVVLSACETGTGLHEVGAGVETLSRTLLDNGAETVVKALWKVNDAATKELMTHMYTQLFAGHSLRASLLHAQEHLRSLPAYAHPYYWSGIVLEGNPEVYLQK